MDLETATADELAAEVERCDALRLAAKERGRAAQEALARKLAEDHAAGHGLTVGQYAAAKADAKARGVDFADALRAARRAAAKAARDVQVAHTTPAAVGVQGVK